MYCSIIPCASCRISQQSPPNFHLPQLLLVIVSPYVSSSSQPASERGVRPSQNSRMFNSASHLEFAPGGKVYPHASMSSDVTCQFELKVVCQAHYQPERG